ncbi:serine hydrolase domain-containing protein [Streptomyces griseocarneus]|uniref:serine hydrolase domain-containing protein n=1 Tax=Streptomyces griseocarneus TaxID=51201 RepID=UPI0019CDA00E|nr:serine hydrolase [Streptomyces griseocarneus]MBZ6475891.1 beta-lactamase family protein [Streptomyces griseocarneus]GHG50176.1 hypothetical protein GCM10018779_10040 [Streptomyces griseocarneus]
MSRTPTCVLSSDAPPRAIHGHSPDLFVEIGSLTKVLTGTALMRMAEAGVVATSDPVERWLKASPGTGVTLQHLVDHTSGLPRLPPGLPRRDPYRSFDEDALRGLLGRLDRIVVTPAGEAQEYSNLGYAVLGAALSAAAKLSFEEVIRKHVLAPLGIYEVTAHPPAEQQSHATGFLGRRRAVWTMDGAILPAGGMWATPRAAADLLTGLLVDRKLGTPAPTWQTTGKLTWHNGATRSASVFAGVIPGGRWVLVHRLGGSPDDTDHMGVQFLARQRSN